MKLKLTQTQPRHGEGVAAAAWVVPGSGSQTAVSPMGMNAGVTPSLVTISDDGSWHQYTHEGEFVGRVFVFSSPAAGQKGSSAAAAAAAATSTSGGADGLSASAVANNPAGGTEYGVCDVSVSASQDAMACACADGTLRMFAVVRADTAAALPTSTASAGPNAAAAAAATAAAMKAAAERSSGRLLAVREEKKVVASSGGEGVGAITCVRWSPDGGTLATGGEDGCVKIWSRACMLRTTLVTAGRPIYSLAWSADGSSIVYACGKEVCIVHVGSEGGGVGVGGGGGGAAAGGMIPAGLGGIAAGRPGGPGGAGGRGLSWKAHDGGIVTKVDWSHVSGRIVSGGEDMKYKVWDPLGRLLSSCGNSNLCEAVITCLSWAPGLASSNTNAGGDVLNAVSSSSSSSSAATTLSGGNVGTCCAYSGASSGVSPVNERFVVGCFGSLRVVDGTSCMVTHIVSATPPSSVVAGGVAGGGSSNSASDSKAGDATDSKTPGGGGGAAAASRRTPSLVNALGRSQSASGAAGMGGGASSGTATNGGGAAVSEEAIEAALGPQLPPFCGSVTVAAWNTDGSLCGIGTGNGSVVVATPVNIGASTPEGTFTVTLAGPKLLKAADAGIITTANNSATTTAATTTTSEAVASSLSSSIVDVECRDRVTGFSLGHGHLIVLSPSHVAIYSGAHSSSSAGGAVVSSSFSAPSHTIDNLKSPVRFVSQAPRHFVAIDAAGNIAVYSYDGRCLCTPKAGAGGHAGSAAGGAASSAASSSSSLPIRVDALSSNLVSICHDVLAICDKTEGLGGLLAGGAGGMASAAVMMPAPGAGHVAAGSGGGRIVRMWDIKSGGGRALPAPIVHHQGISFLSLSNGTVPAVAAAVAADKAAGATSTASGGSGGGIPAGGLADRRLFLIDASADGYLTPVIKPSLSKIATMVDSGAWNTHCDTLTLLTDGSVITWLAPTAAAAGGGGGGSGTAAGGGGGLMVADGTGMDLPSRAKVKADASIAALFAGTAGGIGGSIGGGAGGPGGNASATILCHSGSRLSVRRADGAIVHAKASAFGQILHECVASGKWKEALRLARFVKADALWAGLAALALSGPRPHLETAEAALAAIKAVDKLSWVSYVRSLPLPERRNAEMAAYRRQFDEAEAILLQAAPPLLYRALKLNIRMHRWDRAMQLALQHAQAVASGRAGPNAVPFVDLVLWYRARFNDSLKREENSELFLKAAAQLASQGVVWDDASVLAKKRAERDKEAARAAALPPQQQHQQQASASSSSLLGSFGGSGSAATGRSAASGGGGSFPSSGGGMAAAASSTKLDEDFAEPEL